MSLTLANGLVAIRERLNESTTGQWSDTELTRWMNEGARDMARKAEVLLASSTIAVTGGTQQYTLPTNLLRLYRATYQITGNSSIYPLTYQDYNAMDQLWGNLQTIASNIPRYFTIWGNPPTAYVILYPTPSSNGSLVVQYYRNSTDVVSVGDIFDLPEGWTDVMLDYAEFRAMRRDRDQRWQDAKQQYEQNLDSMIGLTRRYADASGQITNQNPGGLPSWLTAMA